MKKIICLTAILLNAIFIRALTPEAALGAGNQIRLAHAPHDHHAALYVAASKADYFRSNGGIYLREISKKKDYELVEGEKVLATVTIDSSTGGGEIIRKLAEDQFDIAFGGFPPMVQAIDEGKPIKIIAPVMSGGSGLILAASLEAKSWDEFVKLVKKPGAKQFRIGHQAAGSVQSLALERALEKEGIKTTSNIDDASARVVLVDLHGPKNFLSSLKGKVVDGFIAMQPYVAAAQEEKLGNLAAVLEDFSDEKGAGLYPCCALAARRGFLERDGETTVKLVRLLMAANIYLAGNPKEASTAVASWLGEKPGVEQVSLPTIRFIAEFDDQWKRGVNQWIRDMTEAGKLKGKVKKAAESGGVEEVIYDLAIHRKAVSGL